MKIKSIEPLKLTFIILLTLFYFSSCNSTKHYKVLSFFFDGVPAPSDSISNNSKDSIKKIDSTALAQGSSVTLVQAGSVHPPYKENQCGTCHNPDHIGKLNQEIPQLCYQCHEDFSKKYKVLHGPVNGGSCTACHNPHNSQNPKLLHQSGQSMCLYCHDSKRLFKSEIHQDIKDTKCTECHNPHGGNDKFVLN